MHEPKVKTQNNSVLNFKSIIDSSKKKVGGCAEDPCNTTPCSKLNVGRLGMPFMVGSEKPSRYCNKKHLKSQVDFYREPTFSRRHTHRPEFPFKISPF
jgi:hypothetical protein